MSTTFDDLVSKVPLWLYAQNRDIVAEMPKIIADAEEQLYLRLDHDLFQTILPRTTMTAGNSTIDLTLEQMLEVRAVRVIYRDGGLTPLERRDLEMVSMLYAQDQPGRPRYYADFGNIDTLKVFPTPAEDIEYEVTANIDPPRLSQSVQSNIVAVKYPRALERAVLRQGAIFMKNPQDEAKYEKEMDDAIGEANAQIARRRRDNSATRPVDTTNTGGQ